MDTKRWKVPEAVCCLIVLALLIPAGFETNSAESQTERITLVFAGDIMLGRNIQKEIDDRGDLYYPFRGIGEFTKNGDITFGNLENCVSVNGTAENKMYTFRSKPTALSGLKDAGFDIMSLANNHVCDFGLEATKDTMTNLEEYGIKHVGLWYKNQIEAKNATIKRPVIIEAKGVKFAYLCYGENLSYEAIASESKPAPVPTRIDIMTGDIEYAKTIADVVIVSIHWCRLPQYIHEADEGQIEMCRKLCDAGADILANHGPHVAQEMEMYNGSLIMYSLGNAVFDLVRPEAFKSIIAKVHLDGPELMELELIPIVKNDHQQFIPRGNILKVNIEDGLYLDWSDYDSRLFNSQKALTDYEEPPLRLKDVFTSLMTWLVALVVVFIIIIGILLFMLIRTDRANKAGEAK